MKAHSVEASNDLRLIGVRLIFRSVLSRCEVYEMSLLSSIIGALLLIGIV